MSKIKEFINVYKEMLLFAYEKVNKSRSSKRVEIIHTKINHIYTLKSPAKVERRWDINNSMFTIEYDIDNNVKNISSAKELVEANEKAYQYELKSLE